MLNRTLIILKAKKPFLDWCLSLPDNDGLDQMSLEGLNKNSIAYLIPQFDFYNDIEKHIKETWSVLFEEELGNLCTDDDIWPENRTYEMFKKWFEIEIHTDIRDFADEPLETDDTIDDDAIDDDTIDYDTMDYDTIDDDTMDDDTMDDDTMDDEIRNYVKRNDEFMDDLV